MILISPSWSGCNPGFLCSKQEKKLSTSNYVAADVFIIIIFLKIFFFFFLMFPLLKCYAIKRLQTMLKGNCVVNGINSWDRLS